MLNMNIMTLQERVHRRSGHIAVSYKDSLLVWGGFMEGHSDPENGSQMYTHEQCSYHYTDEIWTYHHDTELWKRLLTSGDIPPPTCGSCGVVLGDSLYVFGGFCHSDSLFGNTNQLYRLDLTTLRWHLLTPGGQAPASCDKLAGWAHRDKVYFFGGFGPMPDHYTSYMFVVDPSTVQSSEQRGWNNQLVAYEPGTNTWVWPKVGGEAPCPRAAHAADITGDRAYIFGGRFMLSRRFDLVCLDYSTMRWNVTCLSSPSSPSGMPTGRSWHSFTFISPDRAILYGGLNNQNVILSDSWCVDVSLKSAVRVWKQIPREREHSKPDSKTVATGRFWHQTVASPGREALCVVGGTIAPHNRIQFPRDHAEELLVLEFTPKALFRLSMDAVLKTVPVNQWYETRYLPKDVEDILVLRLEQNPSLSLL